MRGFGDPVVEGRTSSAAVGASRAIALAASGTAPRRHRIGRNVGGAMGDLGVCQRRSVWRPLEAAGPLGVPGLQIETAGVADVPSVGRASPEWSLGGAAVAKARLAWSLLGLSWKRLTCRSVLRHRRAERRPRGLATWTPADAQPRRSRAGRHPRAGGAGGADGPSARPAEPATPSH